MIWDFSVIDRQIGSMDTFPDPWSIHRFTPICHTRSIALSIFFQPLWPLPDRYGYMQLFALRQSLVWTRPKTNHEDTDCRLGVNLLVVALAARRCEQVRQVLQVSGAQD